MSREEKRNLIINYIKSHPNATHRELRSKLRFHIERVFSSLKEAFEQAGLKPPRTFEKKTPEQKRKIVIDYIKKNPKAGGHIILRDTKINYQSVFKDIKDAFVAAGVEYPREKSYKESPKEKKKRIIKMINENPNLTTTELSREIKINPYRYFKSINGLYKEAGLKIDSNFIFSKRKNKKKEIVVDFIKKNPVATQREINIACKTHVQSIFDEGIFEAYRLAKVLFPFERLKLYGIGLKEVKDRAKSFEDEIALILSGYGKVNRLVKTKRGYADIIFERENKKAIIEVKDYQLKDISISQINQLNKYLEDSQCNLGFLVCYKKPKKDIFLIGKNKIIVLEKSEVKKIPGIMTGLSYNG